MANLYFKTLHDEIVNDPLGVGYDGMSDSEAAQSLNAKSKTISRDSIPTESFVDAISPAFMAITDAGRQYLGLLIGQRSRVSLASSNVRDTLQAMFADHAGVRNAIQGLLTVAASRAEELGLGVVREGYVSRVRGESI